MIETKYQLLAKPILCSCPAGPTQDLPCSPASRLCLW